MGKKNFKICVWHYFSSHKRRRLLPCDFTQAFAAIGSKRLPQEQQKPPFLISQNCPQSENGSIRLARVLIRSNGLPKVQVQSSRFASEGKCNQPRHWPTTRYAIWQRVSC